MKYIEELCSAFDAVGIIYIKEAMLKNHCTFRIGGPAALLIQSKNEAELITAIRVANTYGAEFIVIGNGSNIVFSDAGYGGMILSSVNQKEIKISGNILYADCGASLYQMSHAAAGAGLAGLEFAYGIPGTCGGAVYMNAGAYGSQFSSVLKFVRCYDIEADKIREIQAADAEYDYRQSVFMHNKNLVILSAVLNLYPDKVDDIEKRMREVMQKRRDKQPLEFPSAGSVFKRRPGYFMGQLIEECGLKGYRIGGAAVSEKHAGFIVNTGGACAKDVMALVEYIKTIIEKKYGFIPECEIRFVGDSDTESIDYQR